MAILITYPKHKIPLYWRMRLEQQEDVIYFPFRVLKPVKLSREEIQQVKKSATLVITSLYGAKVLIEELSKLNKAATIYVLSDKIKKVLQEKIKNPIKVAESENRNALLKDLEQQEVTSVCWLIGDKAEKYYDDFIGSKVVIYQNTWDKLHASKGLKIFLKHQITSILVTSSSNFDRMYEVMTKVDSSDYKHVNYYVLGTSTGKYLATKGLKVKVPTEKRDVLAHVLESIWQSERNK